jgi:hypothetical protein
MACDITAGFSLGCRDNAGGIKTLYILSGSVTTITEARERLQILMEQEYFISLI